LKFRIIVDSTEWEEGEYTLHETQTPDDVA